QSKVKNVSPGCECGVCPHLFPLWWQRRLRRTTPLSLRIQSELGRCRVARVLREPEGRQVRRHQECQRALLAAAEYPARQRRSGGGADRRLERGREVARR